MLLQKREIKAAVLAMLIAVGLCVHSNRAHAAEAQELVVAGGCFWCVEADFEKVPGVIGAVSGFTGGKTANPTYRQVSKGNTGHFEAVKITFDPDKVTRSSLLNLFFRSVDPTDAKGQFCDRGASYRTAIFFSDTAEKDAAEAVKASAEKALGQEIVTPILPLNTFYAADSGHQDYYKSTALVITRFGPRTKAKAYKLYRKACGRDARVRALWGGDAPFAGQS